MPRLTKLSRSIAGRGALVTGAASGMGRATAHLFADEGAQVAVTDLDKDAIERVVEEIQKAGGKARGWVMNVGDDADVARVVPEIAAAFGRLDIVVNNAGIGAAGTVEDNDDAEWHRVLDVNVLGIVRTTRAALPLLRQAARQRGQAAIVNTCSIAAIAGLPQRALYSATKGAVYSLTLAMAADHVAEGIRFNCVTPGTADTPWVGRLLDAAPPSEPTATSRTATWCWAREPEPTRSPTSRSRPATSQERATPAQPAGSTTSTCSTCDRAASPRAKRAAC